MNRVKGTVGARTVAGLALVVLALAATGCERPGAAGSTGEPESAVSSPSGSPEIASPSTVGPTESPTATAPADWPTVPMPGPLRDRLHTADLLVYSPTPLSDDMVRRVQRIDGVETTEHLSLAQVAVQDKVITVAAVDPDTYRRFTPRGSATLQDAWDRVAGGEVAFTPVLGQRLQDDAGQVQLGNDRAAPVAHIGALVTQIPRVDAVVNTGWGERLGMHEGNALLISTGLLTAPASVRPEIQRIVGEDASVQMLAVQLDTSVQQTAVLTGGSVADAVGTFSYDVLDGGRIAPDPDWVDDNIRTESVPILGEVTCHKVMLTQFRAALEEIVARGLAEEIHPDEYAGCYYPRFIANTTQLSLHSFGIAFDINVPGNLRGTTGEIHPEVVDIFKKWGFAWGGDWNWTDPMHFEMDAIVEAQ